MRVNRNKDQGFRPPDNDLENKLESHDTNHLKDNVDCVLINEMVLYV